MIFQKPCMLGGTILDNRSCLNSLLLVSLLNPPLNKIVGYNTEIEVQSLLVLAAAKVKHHFAWKDLQLPLHLQQLIENIQTCCTCGYFLPAKIQNMLHANYGLKLFEIPVSTVSSRKHLGTCF